MDTRRLLPDLHRGFGRVSDDRVGRDGSLDGIRVAPDLGASLLEH
jgi:hypothetical protein